VELKCDQLLTPKPRRREEKHQEKLARRLGRQQSLWSSFQSPTSDLKNYCALERPSPPATATTGPAGSRSKEDSPMQRRVDELHLKKLRIAALKNYDALISNIIQRVRASGI